MGRFDGIDEVQRGLVTFMKLLLWASLVGVVVVGYLMIRDMGGAQRSQGGSIYVGVAVIVVAVVIIDKLVKLHTKGRL